MRVYKVHPRRIVSSLLALTLSVTLLQAIPIAFPRIGADKANAVADSTTCAQTTGNATVTVSGNDCILTFTSGSTWTIPNGVNSVRFLIVGGGAGGRGDGGGGGGGGAGKTSTVSVTSGASAHITVGAGGSGESVGGTSSLDLDGNNVAEWNANGGALGGGWAWSGGSYQVGTFAIGGNGGSATTENSVAGSAGGHGGSGPGSDTHTGPVNASKSDGFKSDISGKELWYGGGGSGGIGAHANGTSNATTPYGGEFGGKGGGGAGSKQVDSSVTSVSIGYLTDGSVEESKVVLSANCNANSSRASNQQLPRSTKGWPGLNGFGGGGGGGAAYGDGCSDGNNPSDDGERTAGGNGGNGVVIIRFAVPYSVTYNANNATGGTAPDTAFSSHGATFTTTTNSGSLVRTGYTFAGWNTAADGNGTTYVAGTGSFTITSATTLYAKWTPLTYTVTYTYNSATGGNTTSSATYTTGGSAITLPSPTKTNYTFDGWYSNAELTVPIGSAGGSYSPTGTTTSLGAYAKWRINQYVYWYNLSTDSSHISRFDMIIGQASLAVSNGYGANAGYTINAGWCTTPTTLGGACSGTLYLEGATLPSAANGDVVLYAYWPVATYAISVTQSSNGTIAPSTTSVSHNGSQTFTITPNSGYVVASITVDGTALSSSTTPTLASAIASGYTFSSVTSTHSITATYSATSQTVTYAINGGSGTLPTQANVSTGGTFSVASGSGLSKSGYIFAGWSDGSTTYQPGTNNYTMGAVNVVLTAVWGSAPTFTSINTATAKVAGGESRIITGTVLNEITSITVGGTAATITAQTSTTLTFTTPALSAGQKDIVLTYAGGSTSAANAIKYYALITITGISPSSATSSPGNTIVISGTNFVDITSIGFYQAPVTTFTVNSSTQITLTSPIMQSGSNNITIVNPGGSVTSTSTINIMPAAPVITSQPASVSKVAGQSATFTVTVTAVDDGGTLEYQWKKNGTDISGAISATLTIASASSADVASYTVVVTHTQNTSRHTSTTSNAATLTLSQSALSVTSTSGTYGTSLTLTSSGGSGTGSVTFVTNTAGCTISGGALTTTSPLTCVVTATKAADASYAAIISSDTNVVIAARPITITAGSPSVAWTGSAVSPTNTFSVTSGSLAGSDAISSVTYTYSTANPTNAGTYTITPSVAVFSTGNASNYTITYATGTLTISASAPGAPTVTATSNENQQSVLTWSGAATNGSAITGYTVTATYSVNNIVQAVPVGCSSLDSTATGCTFTGLINGANYTFSVKATNAAGTGSAGTATATPATTPSAPRSFAGSMCFTSKVCLSWLAPLSNGGQSISSYTVSAALSDGTSVSFTGCTSLDNSSLSCIATGLTYGTAYTFTIYANNLVGTGATATTTFTPAVTPGAPQSFNATSNANSQSVLSWTAPLSNGGSSITRYNVSASYSGGAITATGCTSLNGTATGCTLTGLTNGTLYTFTVTATNGIGTGASTTKTATPSTTPDAPTNVVGTNDEDAKSTVSWTGSASNGGGAIDYYTLLYKPSSGSFSTFGNTANGSTTSLLVTGLTNGTSYTFAVIAHNASGSSAQTDSAATYKPKKNLATANAPTVAAVANNTTAINVTFSIVTGADGMAVKVYSASSGGTAVKSSDVYGGSTTYMVTGLTASTDYWVSVQGIPNGTNAPSTLTGGESTRTKVTTNAAAAAPNITTQPLDITRTYAQRENFSVVATAVSGGTLSYQWQKNGVNISLADAATYTSPQNNITGLDGPFTVIVTNSLNGTTASTTSNSVYATYSAGLASLGTVTLNATAGTAFSYSISPTGGKSPFTFETYTGACGTWPSWLTLSSSGVLSGTPTTAATHGNLCFQIKDANYSATNVGNSIVQTNQWSIVVSAAMTFSASATQSLTVGTAYNVSFAVSGGRTAIAYSILSGSLPTGLTLNTSDGYISGTPTTDGTFTATIRATDANSVTKDLATTFTVSKGAAVNPSLGTATRTTDGFTTQLASYDSATYTYGVTTTAGSAAISGSGLVTVTGLNANTSATITVTAARTGYTTGSSNLTASSLAVGLFPAFTSLVRTTAGFTFTISNYDAAYTWVLSASSGSVSNIAGAVTVTGLAAGVTSTITVTASKSGSTTLFNTQDSAALSATSVSVALAAGATSATYGTAVILTATAVQAGSITFKEGSTAICSNVSITASPWTATCSWTPGTVGINRNITAEFTPTDSANYAGSTSTAVNVTVNKAALNAPTVSITAVDNSTTSITVSITHASNATSTQINGYSALTGGSTVAAVTATVAAGTTTRTFTGLTEGATYYFSYYSVGGTNYSDSTASTPRIAVTVNSTWYVSYNTSSNGGGVNPAAVSFVKGGTAIVLNTPAARSGYTPLGWFDSLSGGNKIGNGGDSYTPTGSITLYFQWSAITYTITYKAGTNGTGNDLTQTFTVASWPTLKQLSDVSSLFTRTGYHVESWNTSAAGSGTRYLFAATYGTAADLTVYAIWNIDQFDITATIGANGSISGYGTGIDYGTNRTVTFVPNSGYKVVSITIDGTVLSGTNLTNAIASGVTFNSLSANYAVAATFGVETYTVTYKSGANASGSDVLSSFNFGSSVTIKNFADGTSAFPRPGYELKGWTSTDGSATVNRALGSTYNSAANIILYPVWVVKNFLIFSSGNSNTSGTVGSITYKDGDSKSFATSGYIRTGYMLSGWNSAADGLGTTIALGATITTAQADSLATYDALNGWIINLYAVWVTAPTYTSINTATAKLAGGETRIITGTALSGISSMTVDGVTATITAQTSTSLTFTTPTVTTAGLKNIVLSYNGGAITTSNAIKYYSLITITSFTPTSGTTNGGTTVTVTGTNFVDISAVKLYMTNVASFTVVSTTSLTFVTPILSNGGYDLHLINPGGDVTAASYFMGTVDAPVITSQPASTSVSSGSNVTFTVSVQAIVDGGSLSYQWKKDGTDIPSAINASLTINGVTTAETGSYTVVVRHVKGNNGTNTTSNAATLKLTQAASITSTAPLSAKVGQTYTLTATGGGSNIAMTLGSTTASVCTISSGTVTFIAVGTCTLTADQAGDSTYAAATQATQSFAVGKGVPVLSNFADISKSYGSANFTLTAPTVGNSLAGSFGYVSGTTSVATISTATVSVLALGTTVITATFTPTDTTNYTTATITLTLTVSQGSIAQPNAPNVVNTPGVLHSLNITWTAATGASSYTAIIYDTTGTTVVKTVTGLSGTSATLADSLLLDDTGYRVSITAIANSNYTDSIESTKAASAKTAKTYTISYDANSATGGSAPTSGSYITGASATSISGNTGSLARTGFTFAGWYTTSTGTGGTAYAASGATYSTAADLPLFAKWTALVPTITSFTPTSPTYGTTVTITGTNFTGATSVKIGTSDVASFTVVSSTSITFVDNAPCCTATTITVTTPGGSVTSASNLSPQPEMPTITSHPANATTSVGQSVTLSVTVTALSDTGTLSYQWKQGSTTITGATSASYTFSPSAVSEAGVYSVVVTNTKLTSFSVVQSNNATLTVNKGTQAPLTITSTSGAFGTNLTLTSSGGTTAGAITYTTPTAGCTIASGVLSTTGAVTCVVTASMAGGTNYNDVSSSATNVVMGKANQTALVITSTSGTYGTNLTLTVSGGTTAGSVTYATSTGGCSITSGVLSTTGAVTCVVTATMAGTANYNEVISSATNVVIGKALVTITAANTTATYTGSALSPTNSFTITSGALIGSDAISSVSYAYSTANPTAAGTYTITPSAAAFSTGSASNYTITYATGTLNISAASQTITFTKPSDKVYGSGTFTASGTSTSGLSVVISSSTTPVCSVSGTTVTIVSVGTCTLNADQAGTSNYSVATQVSQSFAITQAVQTTLTISASTTSAAYSGTAYTATPTFSTGGGSGSGAVTYAIVSGGSATGCQLSSSAANSTLTATSTGTCYIAATKASETNYQAATSANLTFTFSKAALATPANLAATAKSGSSTIITVTWTTVSNAASFLIKWYDATGSTSISSVSALNTATSIDIAGLTSNTTYQFSISAIASGEFSSSSESTKVSASTRIQTATPSLTVTYKVGNNSTVSVTSGNATASVTQGQTVVFTATTSTTDAASLAIHYGRTKNGIPGSGGNSGTSLSYSTSAVTDSTYNVGTSVIGSYCTSGTTFTAYCFKSVATLNSVITNTSWIGIGLDIYAALAMTNPADQSGTVGTAITSFTPSVTGGKSNYTYQVILGMMPPGLSLNANTGAITGTPTASGNYAPVIRVTDANGANIDVTVNYAITALTQSITFAKPADKTFGDADFTLSATASSNLAVAFASATAGVCTVSGTTLHIVTAGTCTVNATQAGDSAYSAATLVAQSFTINKASQATVNIAATSTTATYTGSAYTASPGLSSTGGSGNGAVTYAIVSGGSAQGCTFTSGTLTATSVGTCLIAATKASDTNYLAGTSANLTFTFTVNTQTITFTTPSNITYGATPASLSATSTSTLTVAFTSADLTICTISGTTVTVLTSGTCTINADQAGDSNYSAATRVVKSFTISKATPVLSSLANATKNYGDSALTITDPTVTGAIPGTFTYSSATTAVATVSGAAATPVAVGTSVITALFTPTDTGKYNTATVTMTLTVAQRSLAQPNAPNATATAGVLKSFAVTWSAVTNAVAYALKIYAADGTTLLQTVSGLSGNSKTITSTEFSAIADNTGYKVGIIATGDTNNADSIVSTLSSAVTTNKSYVITYSGNNSTGGTTPSAGAWITGATATTVAGNTGTLVRTGYTFAGWNSAALGTGTDYVAGTGTYGTAADITMYAKWTAGAITITYNPDYVGGTNVTESKTADTGFNLRANTFARPGYTFAGWATTSGGSVSKADSASVTVLVDTTYYAVWTAIKYTVTYNGNSNTGGSIPTDSGEYLNGASVTVKDNLGALVRTGYSFKGWTIDAQNTGTVYLPSLADKTYTVNLANMTFYAMWEKTVYVVSYNGGGGSDTSPSTYSIGDSITLPANPTKSGYTFSGWFTGSTGGSALTSPYAMPGTGNTTLFAQWSAIGYTVTYNGNSSDGGTVPTNGNTYTIGTSVPVVGNTGALTRAGYTFAGWTEASNGTGTVLVSGGSITAGASNITFYAKWTPVAYSVTYSTAGSTSGSAPTDSNSYNIGNTVSVAANVSLVKTGYTFTGWTVASDGSGTVLNSGNAITIATSNVTLYPKWSANTYNVIFDSNGASGAASKTSDTYTSGGSEVTLATVGTMAKTGYQFAGWATSTNGTALSGTFTTAISVTLYALWTAIPYTVTYNANGGSTTPTQSSLTMGQSFTLASAITKPNGSSGEVYAFVGWSNGSSTFQPGYTYTVGTSNISLAAVWVRVFEVSYALNGSTDSAPSNLLKNDGDHITTAAAPTRTGYEFAGWKDQSGQIFQAGVDYVVGLQHYLLYAQWNAINYTITYAAAGGSTTPIQGALNYGQTFNLASAISRTGYSFNGWSNGTTTYGAGASILVGTSNLTFTAQWTADVYTISYDLNGGTGSSISNSSFTFAGTPITLPLVGDHVRTNYTFGGWSTTRNGTDIGTTYSPTASGVVYAIWTLNQYVITYNAQLGTSPTSSATYTAGGSALTLPTPTRTSFVFKGWYSSGSGGTLIGAAGATYTPGATATVYAQWTQLSLSGVDENALQLLGSIQASASMSSTVTLNTTGNQAAVTIPAGALPTSTVVTFNLLTSFTRAAALISGGSYILSMVISWIAPDGTVPDTASGKPITMVITNAEIKKGATVYAIAGNSVQNLGVATQDGTVTVELTRDPEVVVVKTAPSAPRSVVGTPSDASAIVTWSVPSTTGGSAILSYEAVLSDGQTCVTTALTCSFTGLTNGTSYTVSVRAANAIGFSVVANGSSSFTPVSATPPPAPPTPPTPPAPTPTPSPTTPPVAEPIYVAPVFETANFARSVVFGDEKFELPGKTTVGSTLKWSSTSSTCSVTPAGVITWKSTGTCALNATNGSAEITYYIQVDPRTDVTVQEITKVQSSNAVINATVKWPGQEFDLKFCVGKSTNKCLFNKVISINSLEGQTLTADGDLYITTTIAGLSPRSEYDVFATVIATNKSLTSNIRSIKTPSGIAVSVNGATTITLGQDLAIALDVTGEGSVTSLRAVGLPAGVAITRTVTGGTISGKPRTTGVYFMTVKFTDSFRQITDLPVTIIVNQVSTVAAIVNGAIYKPTSATTTLVSWKNISSVKQIQVKLGAAVVCTTTSTSCVIKQLLGPKSTLQIVATNPQGAVANPVLPIYVAPKKLVEVGTTNFATNVTSLTAVQKKALNKVAADMEAKGFTQLTVYGYTDQSGSKATNDKISLARATAIYTYLKALLAEKQLTVTLIGKGFKDPVASNATAKGRAANRRAVVSIG
ncbi:Listeria/Bacterioides repeat [Candidatus Nanopelagicaceae bacterium]